jgi:hypothetical protein
MERDELLVVVFLPRSQRAGEGERRRRRHERRPKFRSAGGGGTINNANKLSTLTAYKLAVGSPLRDTGQNLSASPFNLSVGTQDFYGTPLVQGLTTDIGAYEAVSRAVDRGRHRRRRRRRQRRDDRNGAWTLKASGSNIWGTSDSFHFVHQGLSGNGTLVARVTSLTNTNASAKAGIISGRHGIQREDRVRRRHGVGQGQLRVAVEHGRVDGLVGGDGEPSPVGAADAQRVDVHRVVQFQRHELDDARVVQNDLDVDDRPRRTGRVGGEQLGGDDRDVREREPD